jgi:two-component sensor histidine kinase
VDVEQRQRSRPASKLHSEVQGPDSIAVADLPSKDPILLRPDRPSAEVGEEDLAVELAGAIQLQKISTRLIHENDLPSLHREIVLAAMTIMRSDFGSMQMYDPARNALYLLVSENFHPESAKFFEWVSCGEATACGKVLEANERVIVPDMEACEFMAGTEELEHQRKCGMRAVQSTPLFARGGEPIGMISTHWRQPHEPTERDWRLFDVLARQAADLIERTQAEERRKLLVSELNHRVKNTLAVVQAIAQQTFRKPGVPVTARKAFEGRLGALAGAHDLLTRAHWESTDLGGLVEDALAVCGVTSRATVDGPPLRLGPSTAVTFAMVLHELCTNAIKYGALSVGGGIVSIHWSVAGSGEHCFHFEWIESGGPAVAIPNRRGFGSRLVERALAKDLKGETRLEFNADGVRFTIDAPLPSHSEPPPF